MDSRFVTPIEDPPPPKEGHLTLLCACGRFLQMPTEDVVTELMAGRKDIPCPACAAAQQDA